MFKLYVNTAGWEKIGCSPNENEIVLTMIGHNNNFGIYNFLIINHVDNTDLIYKRIRNEDDFANYLLDCKERNIDLTKPKKKKKKKTVAR